MKRSIIYLLLICCFPMLLTAQSKPPANKQRSKKNQAIPKPQRQATKISATYFVKDSVIKIRWAPSNAAGWRLGNLFGYVLERYTVMRDGNMLDKVESFRLFGMVPDSLKYWNDLLQSNDNAAIMAQALYGENFSMDIGKAGKVPSAGASILGKAEEEKQRFLFALYAADLDFNVAEKAALGFIDTKAKKGEKYFYRIYPAAPKQYVKSDTALLFVSLDDVAVLPKTAEIIAEPSNRSVVLSWDVERTKNYYNSFFIERKREGDSDFTPVNDIPFASFAQTPKDRYGNAVVFTDTGLITDQKYFYRVRGKTIFDEKGPWSDTASVTILALLDGVPGIQGISIDKKGTAWLNWYFEDSIRNRVKDFEIAYSPTGEGDFQKIIGGIASHMSEVALPDSLPAGYLIVKVNSKNGLSRTSFPYLYQPEDSIPPSVPLGVQALIDSNGVVVLKWTPNTEKDLLGYKVYRSLQQGEEKAVLVDTVWYKNEFRDTLNLKIKNRRAYYTITALDTRFNQSKESKEITVTKPDRIPPSSPVFEDFFLTDDAIEIKWINSSDDDVRETELQRKAEGDGDWKAVFTARKKEKIYRDKDILPQKKYSYRLYAIDSANLRSADAQVLNVVAARPINRKAITKLDAQVDREKKLLYVNWEIDKNAKIKSIEIFKGEDKTPISLYKVLQPGMIDIIESELTVNTIYRYGVRVQFITGEYSDLVIKEINY